jgi:hypothetical protein
MFGYRGELKEQKRNMLNLIKKYKIPIIRMDNEKYSKFTSALRLTPNNEDNPDFKEQNEIAKYYPELSKAQLKSKPIHTFIMPYDLKDLWLVVDTEKGELIRKYVSMLDSLFHIYLAYQKKYEIKQRELAEKFYKKELEESRKRHEETIKMLEGLKMQNNELLYKNDELLEKNDDLKEDLGINQEILMGMNSKLDKATDERAPKTEATGKRDTFMIIKTNKVDYQWPYYAIRVQHGSLRQTLKKLKAKYPNYTKLVDIPYQPNGINFFNLMKEKLRNKAKLIETHHNKIKRKVGYTEEQFLQDIKDLDMSKKEVEDESKSDSESE